MKKDTIEQLFEGLRNEFDMENPEEGHEQRFLKKLQSSQNRKVVKSSRLLFYKSLLAVAAVLVICFGFLTVLKQEPKANDLASVSEQLSQTQEFFTTAITSELNKIKTVRTPENEALISDALKQMELLENNYERLKVDLKVSGNDQRVIFAMINNLQSRIDLLQTVLASIENLKQQQSQRLTL